MNMSCRPHTTVRHRGTDACRRVVVTIVGFGGAHSPEDWCRRLDLEVAGSAIPESVLRAHLDEVSVQAGLPDFAPVIVTRTSGRADNLALAVRLAIFAKSSGRVFLARRTPILSSLVPDRTLALAFPLKWRLP